MYQGDGGKENTKVTDVIIITIIPGYLWKQEQRKTKVPNVTNVTIVTIILGCLIQEKQSTETMPFPNVTNVTNVTNITNVTNVTIILGCVPKLENLTIYNIYIASYARER